MCKPGMVQSLCNEHPPSGSSHPRLLKFFLVVLAAGVPLIGAIATSETVAAKKSRVQPVLPQSTASVAVKTNGKIAFTNTRDGNVEIYVMNADGTGQVRLTNNPAFDGDPSWSPDGTKIVFTSTRDGNEEIYTMNADGTNQTRLTNNVVAGRNLDRTPAWSPDGAQIAFASNRDRGDFDIFVMDTDGGRPRNITRGVQADFQDPDWSPDGTRIACSHALINGGVKGDYGVLVMNSDGTNQARISSAGHVDITPRWSTDATKLVFASKRLGDTGTFQIYMMRPDGAFQTRLTNELGENSRPGWSPDGKKIIFQGTRRFSFDVFTMNVDGSDQLPITSSFFDEAQPVWQPTFTTPFNPIDDPELFVRRLYLDFLNREPDADGLDYWTKQITACGVDQACINRKRIDVAAAFFIEQEFQQTGFFVYRLYQASLCRKPTFAEFTVDRGALITAGDLEAAKQALVQNFVLRPEFLQIYPQVLSRDSFVDRVIGNVGNCSAVDLSRERARLIAEYNSSTDQTISRARVIRAVVDTTSFVNAEFNRGFVLAEYFGFLRRDPDQMGFDFWLEVLNNRVPGNFRAMVCAFITSAEYQRRFGSTITHSNTECGP